MTIAPSSAEVIWPTNDGGVCGNPPGGASGSVGGITSRPWKRTDGSSSLWPPNGLESTVDSPNEPSLSKLLASAVPMRSYTIEYPPRTTIRPLPVSQPARPLSARGVHATATRGAQLFVSQS